MLLEEIRYVVPDLCGVLGWLRAGFRTFLRLNAGSCWL